MKQIRLLLLALFGLLGPGAAQAAKFTIAAASDLRYALEVVIGEYRKAHPGHQVEVIYGSSGKMSTQIINGAPCNIFFRPTSLSLSVCTPRVLLPPCPRCMRSAGS